MLQKESEAGGRLFRLHARRHMHELTLLLPEFGVEMSLGAKREGRVSGEARRIKSRDLPQITIVCVRVYIYARQERRRGRRRQSHASLLGNNNEDDDDDNNNDNVNPIPLYDRAAYNSGRLEAWECVVVRL